MVDNWHTDNPLCDIGPMPWGDNVVDVEDLKVLAKRLFEDVNDPTLIAHWPLDEIEGSTANESIGGSDDFVMGGPVWQPTSGKVNGALQLDGVDDCVISACGINPVVGPFSVLAWIKGGAPGQVVLSQAGAVNWLCTDLLEGYLMTELKEPGRFGESLLSQACITDGTWHRIGLIWDGTNRILCVDGIEVARDTLPSLAGAEEGLVIGRWQGHGIRNLLVRPDRRRPYLQPSCIPVANHGIVAVGHFRKKQNHKAIPKGEIEKAPGHNSMLSPGAD